MGDKAFNGITWAVSTSDSMEGPYVDVVGKNNTALPAGAEGVLNVAVNDTHAFSAWTLPNGVSSAATFAPSSEASKQLGCAELGGIQEQHPRREILQRRAHRASRSAHPWRPLAAGRS